MNIRKLRSTTAVGAVTALIIAAGALSWDTSARAQAAPGHCSDQTLNGSYAFEIDGQVLSGPFRWRPARSRDDPVRRARKPGPGGFRDAQWDPRWTGWRSVTGTYQVNADCTGEAVLNPSDGSPSLHRFLVVANHGQEIKTVCCGQPDREPRHPSELTFRGLQKRPARRLRAPGAEIPLRGSRTWQSKPYAR
jgi:hypothetical protein